MMTLDEALARLGESPDRATLTTYIARAWVRPARQDDDVRFEEIDLARVRLVHHLRRDMNIDEHALDVVLHLLDQVYTLRDQMRRLHHALGQQPHSVRDEISRLLAEVENGFKNI